MPESEITELHLAEIDTDGTCQNLVARLASLYDAYADGHGKPPGREDVLLMVGGAFRLEMEAQEEDLEDFIAEAEGLE